MLLEYQNKLVKIKNEERKQKAKSDMKEKIKNMQSKDFKLKETYKKIDRIKYTIEQRIKLEEINS